MKRKISAAIFGLGLCMSLTGCAVLLGVVFCMGSGSAPQEEDLFTLYSTGVLLGSILNFWKRRIGGVILLLMPLLWVYAAVVHRDYLLQQGFPNPQPLREALQQGVLAYAPVWALGSFAFLTGLYGWSEVLTRKLRDPDLSVLPFR